ncbi:hypothetical protein HanRHA438_Chr10g0468291 [Helianthus annuus]|nr:hypothetical protein HanRHA438_Chr10g0468291 [Helianthus annuus]
MAIISVIIRMDCQQRLFRLRMDCLWSHIKFIKISRIQLFRPPEVRRIKSNNIPQQGVHHGLIGINSYKFTVKNSEDGITGGHQNGTISRLKSCSVSVIAFH